MMKSLLIVASLIQTSTAMACLPGICEDNTSNELRQCLDRDGTCGHYRGLRFDGQIRFGVDVLCSANNNIYAPFDGVVRAFRPFGSNKDNQCLDYGLSIQASADSQWNGYTLRVTYAKATKYNDVKKGDIIGVAIEQNCGAPSFKAEATPHIQLELIKEGRKIDPTSHLNDCLCTGRICESNPTNRIVDQEDAQKPQPVSRPSYNGVFGYPIECNLQTDYEDGEGNIIAPSQRVPRAPFIYSPIIADYIGRARLEFTTDKRYYGCQNDAIYLQGTGVWKEFTAFIFNARVLDDIKLGHRRVEQGEKIGKRIVCEEAADEIFIEIRYEGRFADMGQQVVSTNCTMPDRFY